MTDATGTCVTVSEAEALTPSHVAVIVAEPGLTLCTCPVFDTTATL